MKLPITNGIKNDKDVGLRVEVVAPNHKLRATGCYRGDVFSVIEYLALISSKRTAEQSDGTDGNCVQEVCLKLHESLVGPPPPLWWRIVERRFQVLFVLPHMFQREVEKLDFGYLSVKCV